jgi:quercetin dioxygenase-like cupin family protein
MIALFSALAAHYFLAEVSETVIVACITGIVTVIAGPVVTVIMFILKDRSDKEALRVAKEDRETIKDMVQGAKDAGGEREDRLAAKIDENTAITQKTAESTHALKLHLETVDGQREATNFALNGSTANPEFYEIRLPGEEYETFGWTTGSLVEWKSEPCPQGRQVRFLVHGPASMGFHFHKVTEVIFTMRGKLNYETTNKVVELFPGQSFVAQIDAIHSASFEEAGEAVCHWPEQDSDILLIGIFPS